MDATPATILVACLLLCASGSGGAAAAGGGGGCSLSSIVVKQSLTDEWAHGNPVRAVTVSNTCHCPQSDVKVDCQGFHSALEVDRKKLKFIYGRCLVNGGDPVVQEQDVTFRYAWTKEFRFTPVSSKVAC
ncbi:hypothetical protein BAE44_0012586 [Dichanthelium oligosanthes]|uniref:Uncharacterized protein n=1 Tax=Dichanthelium oligosanthes TaxID=888268 RepID=A0A1E5VMV9_9POAL|nr:hypothetical protein BAE44_0012586 [Dichanthelium oligosanthes]